MSDPQWDVKNAELRIAQLERMRNEDQVLINELEEKIDELEAELHEFTK